MLIICTHCVCMCVWVSHRSSRVWPTHTLPPCRGVGLLHERWRTSNPTPQLVLHGAQEDQGVQPPLLHTHTNRATFKGASDVCLSIIFWRPWGCHHALPHRNIQHSCTWHYLEQLVTSIVGPTHSAPPHRGTGLLHARERHRQVLEVSPPSSWVHDRHDDHGLNPPSRVRFCSWKIRIVCRVRIITSSSDTIQE